MKICRICKEEKSFNNFHKNKLNKDELDCRCKSCRKIESRLKYVQDPFKSLIRCKRCESKKKEIPFNLDIDYLRSIWTGICPIFNIPIEIGVEGCGSHRSAQLDRVIPELGYIKGNVNYISGRANRIKYDASLAELKQIVYWLEIQLESATTIPLGSTSQTDGDGSGEPLEIG